MVGVVIILGYLGFKIKKKMDFVLDVVLVGGGGIYNCEIYI